jgi:NAD(P)-dependent dehydrogenase (short-subunit alcohol dehydrogenase family)
VVADIVEAGGVAHPFRADVAARDQVFALVEEVIQRWGHIDIWVNNAAIATQPAPLDEIAEAELDRLLTVNFKGPLWGIQAAAKALASGGSIINVSSGVVRLAPPVCPASSSSLSSYHQPHLNHCLISSSLNAL